MQSVRKELIDILNQVAKSKEFPMQFGANATRDSIRLVSELIDREYLDGTHCEDGQGLPMNAVVFGITIPGREYVDQLEDAQFKKSATGRAASVLKYVAVFVLGILGTLLTQWLAKRLGID